MVSSAIEKTISGTRVWVPERVGLLEHLFGVIRSELYNEVRKANQHISDDLATDKLASILVSNEPNPEDIASKRSVLTTFLKELRGKDQEVYEWFSLVGLYGLPESDVLETLGASKNDVANMRRRMRRHISDFVEKTETQDPAKE